MNFVDNARDIRTNFLRICRIRTNFVRISYKFVRNSCEFPKSRPKGTETEFRDFCLVRLGLMGPFGVGLSLNHGD